jgi:myosin heavy chain 6/7
MYYCMQVRRENRSLSTEIKDIMDQISEGGRSIHEIDKIRKRLEAEKMELEAALSEAEGALEQEENKVLRAQLELTQVRQEIERRLAEKEEEFESTRYRAKGGGASSKIVQRGRISLEMN